MYILDYIVIYISTLVIYIPGTNYYYISYIYVV